MKTIFYRLTNGRPMRFVEFSFTDRVSLRAVNRYVDWRGRYWLAESAWALFRVESGAPDEI